MHKRVTAFLVSAVWVTSAPQAPAQFAEEIAAVKAMFVPLQAESFDTNREFCGMIGIDENDRLVIGEARRGRAHSCTPRDPDGVVEIIASYHTHGGFDEWSDSEVPSIDDMLADMDEGVDGWISTPGGRLWFIDGQAGVARQICGIGCLPQDPDFIPGILGDIPTRMTLDQLERFFDELARSAAQDRRHIVLGFAEGRHAAMRLHRAGACVIRRQRQAPRAEARLHHAQIPRAPVEVFLWLVRIDAKIPRCARHQLRQADRALMRHRARIEVRLRFDELEEHDLRYAVAPRGGAHRILPRARANGFARHQPVEITEFSGRDHARRVQRDVKALFRGAQAVDHIQFRIQPVGPGALPAYRGGGANQHRTAASKESLSKHSAEIRQFSPERQCKAFLRNRAPYRVGALDST